jgi:hypothetical protein
MRSGVTIMDGISKFWMLLLACKSLFDMNLTISYRFDFRVLLLS